MLLKQNLSAHFIMLALFFLVLLLRLFLMDFSMKYTNLEKRQRLSVRSFLFPYVTKFLDRRIDSYLSLFYECELYSLEELKVDLVETLHVKRSYAVDVTIDRTPIYTQLTIF